MEIWLYETEGVTETYFQGEHRNKFSSFSEDTDGELRGIRGFQYWGILPYGAEKLRL